MKIALCPINPTIADLEGNARRMVQAATRATASSPADLIVFPELAVCGYPPRDLVLDPGFVRACESAAQAVAEAMPDGATVLIGAPRATGIGRGVANSLLAFKSGQRLAVYDKRLLPTYDVFDEDRYFEPGDRPVLIPVAGRRVGLSICEDLWQGDDAGTHGRYHRQPDPVAELAASGCEVLAVPSATPFVSGKHAAQVGILRRHATRHAMTVVSVNQLGANDDLVFDGHACVIGPDGSMLGSTRGFDDEPAVVDLASAAPVDDPVAATPPERAVFEALKLGIADYARKTGHQRVIIGLSGGIDSALVATLASAALGPGSVLGLSMPGVYSSAGSVGDAEDLAARLGLRLVSAPITPAQAGFVRTLDAVFDGLDAPRLGSTRPDLADENLQSRVRGTILMGVANRTGALVLTTGNKSELAVGYCTLYGDMIGALGPIADLTKAWVYRLARWINANATELGFNSPPIPAASIEKFPSAELAPGQRDQDSLPPYEVLDEIVARYVEGRQSPWDIAEAMNLSPEWVVGLLGRIDRAQYKRQQMPVGLKVSPVAFGPGRRMPVAFRSGRR